MTDKTNEPMAVLAQHIATDGTFDLIENEISSAVHYMNNSQETRDRLELEPGDELPEPLILGVIVAFGDEASIIWHETIDNEDAVIAADYTQDVLADAKTAYANATERLREQGETRMPHNSQWTPEQLAEIAAQGPSAQLELRRLPPMIAKP